MSSISEPALEQCIDALYGSLTAPNNLVDAIRQVRLLFNASGATHLYFDSRGELKRFVDDGHDPKSQQLYVDHYQPIDPTLGLLDLAPGAWLRDDRLLDPRHTPQPEFVNDFAPHIGMRWFAGCKLFHDSGGIATFSLQRSQDAPTFDQREFEALRELQPHLKRVFRMLSELAPVMPRLAAADAAMNALRSPICVVDGECRIVYANPASEALFARADVARVTGKHLECVHPHAHEMLRRAVKLGTSSPRQASSFSPWPSGPPVNRLQIRAIPLSSQMQFAYDGHRSLVLIFFGIGSLPPSVAELQQLFDLTRSEAELLVMLAEGLPLKACADQRDVSLATTRTQLAAVFRKTGAASQAQLVSMVLSLPAVR